MTASKHTIYTTAVADVYPAYVAKLERKGRSRDELDTVVTWLTGWTQKEIAAHLKNKTDFETFFATAPAPNPDRLMIAGSICGVKIQEITESTMREIRHLDKLVDELAKGRPMEKVLRST